MFDRVLNTSQFQIKTISKFSFNFHHSNWAVIAIGDCKSFYAMTQGYSQGKSFLKQNSSAYVKYEYEQWGRWYIKSTLYKRLLKWNKIFNKNNKVVTGKILFFLLGPICTPHSICLYIWLLIWQFFYGNDTFSIVGRTSN